MANAKVLTGQQATKPGLYTWTSISPGIACGVTSIPCATALPPQQFGPIGSTWTITILAACTVKTTPLDFGTVGLLSANIDAQGTIQPQCSLSTPYSVGLNPGTNSNAGLRYTKSVASTGKVNYSIFRDLARSLVWSDIGSSNVFSGTGTGFGVNVTAYGRIPAQVTPSAATYNDTVVVTVSC